MALPEEGTMSYGNPLNPRSLSPRCLQCPDTTPSCPTCPKGQICSLVPADCNTCAYMTCITNPSPAPSNPGPNIGAIAGGVVGGVAAIAMIVFFVWRFWIKKRREQQEREGLAMGEWEGEEEEIDEIARQKAGHMSQERRFTAMHAQDAASTRTRGSLANSFLSRASNIIQIAYIPGVTNRNGGAGGIGSGHNSLLGNANSPVPPIPAATRSSQPPKSPLSNEGDMLFFRPGDLRDSSYSGASSIRSDSAGLRDTQYTRQSITPSLARSSMMSTGEGYRDSTAAVVPPMPATSVARAAPRMVSIKSSHSQGSAGSDSGSEELGSSSERHDFAPASGKGKGIQVIMPGEGGPPSTSSSLRAKPKQITVGGGVTSGGKGRFPVRQTSNSSTLTSTSVRSKHMPTVSSPLAEIEDTDEEEDDDSDEHARAARRSMRLINTSLNQALMPHAPAPLVQPVESPFFDASELAPAASAGGMRGGPNPYASMAKSVGGGRVGGMGAGSGNGHLSDIIEEATRRASRVSSNEGLGGREQGGPFSDAHATE
ncbi:overproduction-induced pheromone-resistant [Friedmanniomyces endolithicus]|nr:overproduction-induced pheromone-resistant [Friedmanniomyces endolithicus]